MSKDKNNNNEEKSIIFAAIFAGILPIVFALIFELIKIAFYIFVILALYKYLVG